MNTKERTPAIRPGKITATHLTSLGSRLTDRDRQIAVDCYDHRVLTTEQLMRLHFSGLRKHGRADHRRRVEHGQHQLTACDRH